jgi:hypothetical protein
LSQETIDSLQRFQETLLDLLLAAGDPASSDSPP